jgi:hypothetical protein
MKSMFELKIQFGFGPLADQDTTWVEAETESQARTFTETHVFDAEESGKILSVKIISPDDVPEGEVFGVA